MMLLVILLFNPAIAFESVKPLDDLEKEIKDKVIALISIDVEITRINPDHNQDASVIWSSNARKNIMVILNQLLSKTDGNLPILSKPATGLDRHTVQVIALQSIINLSILGHIQSPLPSKQKFEWSVGEDMRILKQHIDADVGLFLFVRGGFSSETDTPEYQAGFVSLVNLNNGNTIWFDYHTGIAGDFRDPDKAKSSMQILMKNFPVKNNAIN